MAAVELKRDGFRVHKHTEEDLMLKYEAYNHTAKPNQAARLICPVHPVGGLLTAMFIKPIEHEIFRAIDRLYKSPTVCKGLNATKRAALLVQKWGMFKNPVNVSIDAKKFDQSVSLEIMRDVEFAIYKACFKRRNGKWSITKDQQDMLCQLLGAQLRPHGRARTEIGLIKYILRGQRSSGVMNTSLGNVLLMCVVLWGFRNTTGIKMEVSNDGDDSIITVDRADLKRVQRELAPYCLQYGFRMELENTAYELEKTVFCQCSPLHDGQEWIMVRDPRVVLNKDLTTCKPINNTADYNYYKRAKALCGKALANHLPIFGSFYKMMRRGTNPAKERNDEFSGMMMLAAGMTHKHGVSDQARLGFYSAFNITPAEQYVIEEHFDWIDLIHSTPECVESLLPIHHNLVLQNI
jgi:hypothetical protein